MAAIYTLLGVTLTVFAAGGQIVLYSAPDNLLSFVGSCVGLLILLITVIILWTSLKFVPAAPELYPHRVAMLMTLALYLGFLILPVVKLAAASSAAYVPVAAVCTAVCFESFSMSALYVEKNRVFIIAWGVFLSAVLYIVLIPLLLTIDILLFESITKWFLFLNFTLSNSFIVLHTQLLVDRLRQDGNVDTIRHCLSLFVDIDDLFFDILLILMFLARWAHASIMAARRRHYE